MGYRDELDALRVRNEALAAELEKERTDARRGRERTADLEAKLADQKARVAELEILLGGELGEDARKRVAAKRRVRVGLLLMLVGLGALLGFWSQRESARAEMELAERRLQHAQSAAELAVVREANARLEEINARLQAQLESLARRRGR